MYRISEEWTRRERKEKRENSWFFENFRLDYSMISDSRLPTPNVVVVVGSFPLGHELRFCPRPLRKKSRPLGQGFFRSWVEFSREYRRARASLNDPAYADQTAPI